MNEDKRDTLRRNKPAVKTHTTPAPNIEQREHKGHRSGYLRTKNLRERRE